MFNNYNRTKVTYLMTNVVLCHGLRHDDPPWKFFDSDPIRIDANKRCKPHIVHDLDSGMPDVILNNSVDTIVALNWPQLHKIRLCDRKYETNRTLLTGNQKIKTIKTLNMKFPKHKLTFNKILRNKIIVGDNIDSHTSYTFNEDLIASIAKKLK